jgi:hypothetical protein
VDGMVLMRAGDKDVVVYIDALHHRTGIKDDIEEERVLPFGSNFYFYRTTLLNN